MNNNIEARRARVIELHREGKTEREIAEEIGVSRSTVFNDLKPVKSSGVGATAGMEPQGVQDVPKEENPRPTVHGVPKQHHRHREVVELHDQGKTNKEIAEATGVGFRQVRHIVERAIIERQARRDATTIDWETLPGSVKDKMEAVRRQVRRELEAEFESAVVAEVQDRLKYAIKAIERRERDAARVLAARKGVFTKAQYNQIKATLHPDSRGSVSEERLSEAFRLFNEADIVLMGQREYPASSLPSMDDLLKRRGRNAS